MSILELPPHEPEAENQEPIYDYQIALEEIEYRLVLQWRDRPQSWYLSIYDSADIVQIANKRLTINTVFGWRHIGRKPIGNLMLVDIGDTNDLECDYEDLGNRCPLIFFTDGEYPEAVEDIPITIEEIV